MGKKNYDRQGCGSNSGYRDHIVEGTEACGPCKKSRAAWQRGYHKRVIINGGKLMVDSAGTRRRLQALAAIGHSYVEIGEKIGTRGSNLSAICTKKKMVYPETAAKIKAVYDELSMLPAPQNTKTNWSRGWSRRHGFPTPLSWDDEMIDDPYALPLGLTKKQTAAWYWNTANNTEKIEWVLENGFPPQPSK